MSAIRLPSWQRKSCLLLVALAWSLPFLQPHHAYPIAAFYSEWLALALGLAGILVLLRPEPWRVRGAIPAIAFVPLGLALVIGMQVGFGAVSYAEHALVAVLYLLWAAALVVLGALLRRELGLGGLAVALAWALFATGVAGAFAGLAQLYGRPGLLSWVVTERWARAVYGNLAQPNHFAAYTAMACASAAFLYARGRIGLAATATSLGLFAFVLAVAGSRSSWLYLGAFAILGLVSRRMRGDAESTRLAACALALLALFAAAQWTAGLALLEPALPAVTPLRRMFEGPDGVAARLQLAGEAWRIFLASPLAGAGWGQFAWHHFLHMGEAGPGEAAGICNHAHNVVLHLLAETGIAGGLILAGATLLLCSDMRRLVREPEWWWCAALFAVLGIHSLLEYPLWYAYFLGIAAVLAGACAQRAVAVRRVGPARAVIALFALSGAVNLAAVVGPYRELERLMADAVRGGGQAPTERELAAAFANAAREPLLAPYTDLVAAHAIDLDRERLTEQLALNARALRFAPLPPLAYQQAMLLALAGETAAARRVFEQAARAYPGERDAAVARLRRRAIDYPAELTPLLELRAAQTRGPGERGHSGDDARAR